jgi:MFS family permease
MNGTSAIGRIVPNMLADRLGPFNVYIPACFILGALQFAMFGVASTVSVIVFAVLYGIVLGSCGCALWPTCKYITDYDPLVYATFAPLVVSFAKTPEESG